MGRETRAMQDDEQTGPAVLWLLEGEELWGKNCAGCHGIEKMKGVAARYPALHSGTLINLDERINLCRTERQKAPAFARESRELLSLNAFISKQSRGLPIAIESNEQTRPLIEAGRAQFEQRRGQLNLSCAQCHDDNWGKSLAGTPVPQAHPTGYPIYRLEWQSLGSLERRLRNCMIGVRAEPYPYGAREYRVLELFLMWRARGMKLESPGVRP
ncbi:MAG TPA: sulfur oxidation c-type cytochrome SoxA [Burkholderiales bacterium]|nr:sulfur oxidation c-type cytochrome SoxA [Burkholderiales bacterium]